MDSVTNSVAEFNDQKPIEESKQNDSYKGRAHGQTFSEAISSRTGKILCLTAFIAIIAIVNVAINAATAGAVSQLDNDGDVTNLIQTGGTTTCPSTPFQLSCPSCPACPAAASTVSGLPGFENQSWDTIMKKAQSMTLNFYLWSPEGTSPRRWVDERLTPKLKDQFGITVNRIDAVYSGCALSPMKVVCDVQDEVDGGKTTTGGAVDLIWINGENFANMKSRGLLYGPFATLIPSAANFDFTNSAISFDKGVSIDGMEMPFNQAQSVFIHNEIQVPSPPRTIPDLVAWIKANPGRFTYSDPSVDFMGAAFIRTMFYYYAGDGVNGGSWRDFLGPFDEALYLSRVQPLWDALNDIEGSLYQMNGAPWYPTVHEDIRDFVGNETLWLDFSFQSTEASARINNPVNPWPVHMQAYVMDSGTIADTNYLAIPVNSNNKEAALAAVNYITSPGSMFVRAQPEIWGALQPFDPTAASVKEWDAAFNYINTHEATPTVEALAAARLGDLHTDYVKRLNADWVTNVLNA